MAASHLPFLITNGHWISYGAALAVIILSVWNLGRRRHRLAKLRTEESLAQLGPATPVSNFATGIVAVLEGTIESSADAAPDLVGTLSDPLGDPPKQSSTFIDAGKNLVLQGEHEWGLSGPIEIVWARDVALRKNQLHMRVHPGERVRVRGTLHAVAADDPSANYRDAAMEWTLVGSAKQPLELMSRESPRLGFTIGGVIGSALVGLTFFAIAGYVIGSCALAQTEENKFGSNGGTLEVPISFQLAAASPFHRVEGLQAFKSELKAQWNLGSVSTHALVQLALFHGDCTGAARVAWRQNQSDLAKSLIADCPPSVEASQLAFHLYRERGEFSEASAIAENARVSTLRHASADRLEGLGGGGDFAWRTVVQTHLLAGNYAAAAALFRSEAKQVQKWNESLQPGAEPSRADLTSLAQSLRCLAAAAQARVDKVAPDKVAPVVDTSVCRLLQSDRLPPSERIKTQAKWEWDILDDELLLRAEGNIRQDAGFAFRVEAQSILLGQRDIPTNLGLLVSAYRGLAETKENSLQRAALGLELARLSGTCGKLEQALRWAKQVESNLLLHALADQRKLIEAAYSGATTQQLEDIRGMLESRGFTEGLSETAFVLTALATRQGDKDTAHEHLQRALGLSYRPNPILGELLLDEDSMSQSLWQGFKTMHEVNGAPFDADTLRTHYYYMSWSSFEDIVSLRASIEFLEAPQWKAEIDQAIDNWWVALVDRDRSLLLTMLAHLRTPTKR